LAEAEVRKLAFQDALTGLPNRRQFDDALKAALASPPRSPGMHGVFLLDLNGFKRINDIYGHAVGDEVLVIVAQRLFGAMREGDLIARLGGDEFAILAQNLLGPEAATNLARGGAGARAHYRGRWDRNGGAAGLIGPERVPAGAGGLDQWAGVGVRDYVALSESIPHPPRAGRRDGFIIVDCATRGTAPGTGRSSDW
jgi:GGDEF domain-containing protein